MIMSTQRDLAPKMIVGPLQMERWTYNLGSNKFLNYLLFQNGELIQIKKQAKREVIEFLRHEPLLEIIWVALPRKIAAASAWVSDKVG